MPFPEIVEALVFMPGTFEEGLDGLVVQFGVADKMAKGSAASLNRDLQNFERVWLDELAKENAANLASASRSQCIDPLQPNSVGQEELHGRLPRSAVK